MKMFTMSLLALVMSAAAQAQVAPDWVRIRSLTYAGTGCPAGSVAQNISPDNLAFTLLFDNYVAEAGPGVPLSQGRKNCQINVDLEYPAGWTYTLISIDYRGYANLDPGARGTQKATYYFQGSAGQSSAQSTLYGPKNQDYNYRDVIGSPNWSYCRVFRALNINSQVRVDAGGGARGLMTTDSVDGQVIATYGFTWRHC